MYKMKNCWGLEETEDVQALPRGMCTQGNTMKLNITNRWAGDFWIHTPCGPT